MEMWAALSIDIIFNPNECLIQLFNTFFIGETKGIGKYHLLLDFGNMKG